MREFVPLYTVVTDEGIFVFDHPDAQALFVASEAVNVEKTGFQFGPYETSKSALETYGRNRDRRKALEELEQGEQPEKGWTKEE